MSANAALLEAQVRHQVHLLRRGAGVAAELEPLVQEAINRTVAILGNTPDRATSQLVMLTELRNVLREQYALLTEEAVQLSLELAEYEAEYQVGLLRQVSTASIVMPPLEAVAAAALNDLMDLEPGRQMTIRQALDSFGETKARQIIQTITDGVATSATRDEITKTVQGLSQLHRHQAEALVRTVSSGVASAAKRATYVANSDVLEKERYVSTLDSRTTQTCMGLSERVYPVGQGEYPPQHYRCRSIRVPIIAERWQVKGIDDGGRPTVGADGAEFDSARTTMNSWLRRQPKEFQEDFFDKFPQGAQKLKLFREGNLNAQKFVDDSGAALTMDELRARYPDAAQAAGLA